MRAASLVIAVLALIGAVRWTRAHPYPLWWDEANYYNQVADDRRAFVERGPIAMVKSLVFADNERPPAYRALVAPVAAATLPSLALLRGIALCVLLVSLVLVWQACRTFADSASALLATVLVLAMPQVLASGAWFGTEYPLYLAVGLLLLALLRDAPIGVAAAVALGLLAKSSFLFIGGPAVLVALMTTRDRRKLFLAAACGALVAAGWWLWDPGAVLRYAQLGRTFERAASDQGLPGKLHELVVTSGIGIAIAAALLAIEGVRNRNLLSPAERRGLLIGAAAFIPLVALSMFSPVFVGRHFAPALLAVAIPAAVVLKRAHPALRVAVAALALIQVAWIALTPLTRLPRVEQTDWATLRPLIAKSSPRIAFIGGWPSMSPPEIRYGWTRNGADARTLWLWRAEERAIDWTHVMGDALTSDAVLVVPPAAAMRTRAYEQKDNRHNAELMRRLEASRMFEPPVPFRVGTREIIDVLVYRGHARRGGAGPIPDPSFKNEPSFTGVKAQPATR